MQGFSAAYCRPHKRLEWDGVNQCHVTVRSSVHLFSWLVDPRIDYVVVTQRQRLAKDEVCSQVFVLGGRATIERRAWREGG